MIVGISAIALIITGIVVYLRKQSSKTTAATQPVNQAITTVNGQPETMPEQNQVSPDALAINQLMQPETEPVKTSVVTQMGLKLKDKLEQLNNTTL